MLATIGPSTGAPVRFAAALALALALAGCPAFDHARDMTAPAVLAAVETVPVPTRGDAADDPAIWIDARDPAASLVIGTNKKRGLEVYRLDGTLHQSLDVGRMNNVDLREGFALGGRAVALVAASDRDNNAIAFFALDPDDRVLSEIPGGGIATGLGEIYGLCMYADRGSGRFFVFVNDKDGRFQQWSLRPGAGEHLEAKLEREFRLGSQPEGCAADDEAGLLYVGEEAAGFYRMPADPDVPADPVLVDAVGSGRLVADVEGIAILVHPDGTGYLVVSSQGDSTFAVYRRQPPNEFVGRFRVAEDPARGIDGVSETDGLEIASGRLPAPFELGLLVVQDGYNSRPRAPQNFKFVPWGAVLPVIGE
jgi:3-phytase